MKQFPKQNGPFNVLKLPNSRKGNTFELFVDASSSGIGSILFSLEKDDQGNVTRYVIGYVSKPSVESDKKLSATFLELLGLDVALSSFPEIIFSGSQITVWADNIESTPCYRENL